MNVIIFLIAISVLIFVHELGHFVAAKRAGMKVEEFGFGFSPRLWGVRRGETIYSINAIPFGGFVKIVGEDGDAATSAGSFTSKSFGARLLVLAAGVLMNLLFAAIVLVVVNGVGVRTALVDESAMNSATDRRVQIVSVSADSPAAIAGLETFDTVRGFVEPNNAFISVGTSQEIQQYVATRGGQEITVRIERGGRDQDLKLTPRRDPPAGQGPLGVSLALTGVVRHTWWAAIGRGIQDTFWLTLATIQGLASVLWTLVTTGHLIADVTGPVGIARLTGQAASFGFAYLLQFLATISINLAVLNAIPFPALDGGRMLLLVIEKIRGRAVNHQIEGAINSIGFVLLIVLMVVVTVRDIARLF